MVIARNVIPEAVDLARRWQQQRVQAAMQVPTVIGDDDRVDPKHSLHSTSTEAKHSSSANMDIDDVGDDSISSPLLRANESPLTPPSFAATPGPPRPNSGAMFRSPMSDTSVPGLTSSFHTPTTLSSSLPTGFYTVTFRHTAAGALRLEETALHHCVVAEVVNHQSDGIVSVGDVVVSINGASVENQQLAASEVTNRLEVAMAPVEVVLRPLSGTEALLLESMRADALTHVTRGTSAFVCGTRTTC